MDEAFTGFSPRWRDFPDYIIGITHAIWEGREVSALHPWYAEDIVLRSPAGVLRGRQSVISNTLETLAIYPDRQLLAEDVIWSGDAGGGYLSSHRVASYGTHAIDGPAGPATGRGFLTRGIADCAAREDKIFDEWLVRDAGGHLRQLGVDPRAYATCLIASEGGPSRCRRPFTPDQDVDGGYHGRGNDSVWGHRFAETLKSIMAANLTVIPRDYDRAVAAVHPGNSLGHGHPFMDRFWLGIRSAFPNATFAIHHQIGREDPLMPPRAAIRWSLDGRHEGHGAFGSPTGVHVHVMAISHVEYGPFGPNGWSIRRAWTLYDEVQVWKQVLMGVG